MKEREIASETVCKTRTEYSGKSDCLIYQETWRFMENWEQTVIILDEKWPKHFEGAENQPKYEARFGLSMPKNPHNNLWGFLTTYQ